MVIEKLNSEILICDGAMGTMLQSFGYQSGESPEKWGFEHEEILRAIHSGYIKSGADIITTDTFGGSGIKLAKYALESEATVLNLRLAEIAVEEARAVSKTIYVAGDMGPTGELIEPLGMLTKRDTYATFAEQAVALANGGVDLILIETMMDAGEISIAIKASVENTDLPVFALMTFSLGKRGFRTMMGTSPKQAVEAMLEAGAAVVGANCGDTPIAKMPDLISEMKVDEIVIFPEKPEDMASSVPAVLKAGANIVGGCCGTTPDHIRAIAEAVKAFCEIGS
jgi:5-methyltetrahydrofolate--homocysteine methyltransferase